MDWKIVVILVVTLTFSRALRQILQEQVLSSNDSDPVGILVDMRIDGYLSVVPGEVQFVGGTINGCECIGWAYNNESVSGCGNPNGYSRGNWCLVTRDSCQQEPYLGVVSMNSRDVLFSYDLCDCAPTEMCELSYNGCPCADSWMYRGLNLSGCANPDAGVGGPWCPVDHTKCIQVTQVRRLENFEGSVLGFWDYCKPGCCDASASLILDEGTN